MYLGSVFTSAILWSIVIQSFLSSQCCFVEETLELDSLVVPQPLQGLRRNKFRSAEAVNHYNDKEISS